MEATQPDRPPVFKAVGIALAIASGVFIGVSFVLKKMGLLRANVKYNEEAGEGYGYLKNIWWWSGMILMVIGEVCNFAAYAFVDPILVTPLGALSVVITTILSAIFLKERLSFVGKVGCFNCIIGSVVIVLSAPEQSAIANIQGMKDFVIAPGFLTYAGVILLGCAFIIFWVAPRYGKKSMLVYISVCSLIGGLSVVCTQGLGVAVIAQASGEAQFNQWFTYVVLVFVIATLLVEIVYLNKALNIFNAALVTPTYYVFFTSATIVTSAILFQGFKGTPSQIANVIMGFLQICAGVVLLQMSKSAKDVPDAAVFKGDLDQVREIAEQEQPESEPKADAIRGTAALIRRLSVSRQKMEEAEARRYREEKLKDQLEPVAENEVVEWDGLRRRKTVVGDGHPSPIVRRKTIHPPLGMSRFPDENEQQSQDQEDGHRHGFFENVRERASSVLRHHTPRQTASDPLDADAQPQTHPVALTDMKIYSGKGDTPIEPYGSGSLEEAHEHIYGLPPGLQKPEAYGSNGPNSPRSKPLPAQPTIQSPAGAPNIPFPSPLGKSNRRQFSFQNMFRGPRSPAPGDQQSSSNLNPPPSRSGIGSRSGSAEQRRAMKTATEEERLGLVKGDSHANLLGSNLHPYSEHDSDPYSSPPRPLSHELQYPYAASTQDSAASSPEAQTPLVPKHSYLLSNSTLSDNAPLYKELHAPGYFASGHESGYSAPPPPLEEEAGVDDEWQIPPSHRAPPQSQQPQPTSRYPVPTITATSPPSPPIDEHPQLPAYHSNNPYQFRQQQRHQDSTQPRAATAAYAPFPSTSTSPPRNTTADTTMRDSSKTNTRSDSSIPAIPTQPQPRIRIQDPPPSSTMSTSTAESREEQQQQRRPRHGTVAAQQDLDQALAGIEVTSPQEKEYEERWRRFQMQNKEDHQGRRQSRSGGDERGGAAGAGSAGAFI